MIDGDFMNEHLFTDSNTIPGTFITGSDSVITLKTLCIENSDV